MRALVVLTLLLAGCTLQPADNLRLDAGCKVVRDPKTGKIEHLRCDRKYPLSFEWKF